jgi:glycosyltransferase involved in cell wall biosynthesis
MNIFVCANTNNSFNSYRPEHETFMGLARRGHCVTMMTNSEPEYRHLYEEAGIRLIEGETTRKIDFRSIRKIRKNLAEKDYDVVYATNSKTIPNAGFASIGYDVKFVAYRGTTGGLYRHDPSAYLTILHPRVDGVVCVSDAVREDVVKQVWKKKNWVRTIFKGHNIDWYDVEAADLSEFGISSRDFSVICAVNSRPSKGIAVMLEATKELADIENLHLILAGKNMDKEPFSSLIENSGMADRIHVTGYRFDVPQLIKASNLLVQPSISGEGLPRAVMESMGLGTPTVVTTTCGGNTVVEDGKSGFVVPTKDPSAIANRVRQLYHDPELCESMAKAGQDKIRNELSSETTIDNFIKYFEELIAS